MSFFESSGFNSLETFLALEGKMINVKHKDRIHSTIITQRARVTDIVECVISMKWKWAGYIAQMNDNRWIDQLENQNIVGEMMLWNNKEQHEQG